MGPLMYVKISSILHKNESVYKCMAYLVDYIYLPFFFTLLLILLLSKGFDREGKLRAICGGGRYDRLLSTFGGEDIPACGFGFGDAVVLEVSSSSSLF